MLQVFKDLFFLRGFSLIVKAYNRKQIQITELTHIHLNSEDPATHSIDSPFGNPHKRFTQWMCVKSLLKMHWQRWAIICLLLSFLTVLIVSEPYLSSRILDLVKQKNRKSWDLVLLVGLMFVTKGVRVLLDVHVFYRQTELGTCFFRTLSLAIYRHTLQLNNDHPLPTRDKGKVLTLLEQDCTKLVTFPYFITKLLFSCLQIVYGFYYLTFQMSKCDFSPDYYLLVVYLVICFALGYLAMHFSKIMLTKKDRRLACSLQHLASGGDNHHSQQLIEIARRDEISSLKEIFRLETVMRSLPVFYSALFISITLLWNYHNLSPKEIYVIILLYNQISFPISQLPFLVQNLNQLLANISRIKEYLQRDTQSTAETLKNSLSHEVDPITQHPSHLNEFRKAGELSWPAVKFYLRSGGITLFALSFLLKSLNTSANVASSFLNKHLSSMISPPAIMFFSQFLGFIPFAASLSLMFRFSISASNKVYSQMKLQGEDSYRSVTLNLLSNDLRVIDRVMSIIIFDLLTSLLSILKSICLSLYTISLINGMYSIYMLAGMSVIGCLLTYLNRWFMWVRRECSRLQAIAKTPLIQYFLECVHSNSSFSSTSPRMQDLINQIVRTELSGVYYECWYEFVLMVSSLVYIIVVILVASLFIQDPSLMGLLLSQILLLDTNFQSLFVGLVNFEKNSICVERLHSLVEMSSKGAPEATVTLDIDLKESLSLNTNDA